METIFRINGIAVSQHQFSIFIFIAGIIAVISAMGLIIKQMLFLYNTKRTEGHIYGYKNSDGMYQTLYIYKDAIEKEIKGESSIISSSQIGNVGDKIIVAYKKGNSSNSIILSFKEYFVLPCLMGIFGVILLVVHFLLR